MTAHADILVANDWTDYQVLDSGAGQKLEQVGPYRFVRPEPQALWLPRLPESEWNKAHAIFASSANSADEDAGKWRFNTELPETWRLQWDGMNFLSRPTPFRHLAFFPEHSVHWRFAADTLAALPGDRQPEVLNLFGYTGLASLACARAGARVTHVDASKKAIGYARDNQNAAGLSDAPIRWICDDALAFVRREVRRGRRYDGVILDPPKYGRGPDGEIWRLEEGLPELLRLCATLLRENANDPASARGFMIATVYAVRLSFIALAQTAQQAFAGAGGVWQSGEMALPHAQGDRLLPTAIFTRWRGGSSSPP
ncbi:MAG: class I SAM-dependent methyltransferase [Hyphomonadaceae bacterium]|nr:class I SAM-dependent methyltransferase [Hyphomonadaceae bacterium]